MASPRVQEYQEKYADKTVRFNPYAIKKMGLQQSQTMLKLEDYMLICAPYQLSMGRAVLLVILGVQFLSLGFLGELVVRTYHETQNKPIYAVREVLDRADGRSA